MGDSTTRTPSVEAGSSVSAEILSIPANVMARWAAVAAQRATIAAIPTQVRVPA